MSNNSDTPAGIHLQNLVLDNATTSEQKINCLKLLKVVVKNLSDPAKASDEKYRQLKLDNAKVREKILSCPAGLEYLKAIGFEETVGAEGEKLLRVNEVPDSSNMQRSMKEVMNALEILTPKGTAMTASSNGNNNKTSTSAVINKPQAQLTEKQKARILIEEKERREREEARAQRKRTRSLIKQDKYVRENDQNWKSGPSAACAKTGSSISTFRDKYGEN